MKFIHTDLGHCSGGETVRINLSAAANVRLMSQSDFSAYRRGQRFGYQGGLARRTLVDLSVPRAGRWHVVVDMHGLRGSTRASVSLLS